MSKKYYIKNMCWGWFIGLLLLFSCIENEIKFKSLILTISFVGIAIFPFAKFSVERFFLKFTTKEFWNRGGFIDTPGKMGGLALYHGAVFLFSIPITLVSILIFLIKRL